MTLDIAFNNVHTLAFVQGSRVISRDEVCVITEVPTFLIITRVSMVLNKNLQILIFSKRKYLHVKIASLATVKSVLIDGKCLALCNRCGLAIDLRACTVDTTVSSCSVH